MNQPIRWSVPVALLLLAGTAVLSGLGGCDDSTTPPDDGVVRGTVTRIYTDERIAGATVRVGDETATTDASGEFQFPHVPLGTVAMSVEAADYRTHQQAIEVGDWQTVDVALMPLDSLVAITGTVRHGVDGPVETTVELNGRAIATDAQGVWSAGEVPLGPATLVVDAPPYNRVETAPLIQRDGQVLDLVLTRLVAVERLITHDSYIFTDQDSLNANRGQVAVLWASPELGRAAVLAMPEVDPQWHDVPVHAATLRLHGYLRRLDDWDGNTRIPLRISTLADGFFENAIDWFQRPGFTFLRADTVDLELTPMNQPMAIDVTDALTGGGFAGGFMIAVNQGEAGLGILSSEYGNNGSPEAAWRPRIEIVYRY